MLALGLDSALVADVLSAGTRRIECDRADGAEQALERARLRTPDLIVLGGAASAAAAAAEALAEERATENAPVVAWGLRGSREDRSRLIALGVRIAPPGHDAFRQTCEEALDAREGRTIRVDPPAEALEARAEALALHGRRVIVADDDPAILWFFGDVLRRAGCDVDEVDDGEAALDRARRLVPDLVVADIRMPKLDGVRLCRALRSDPILGDVPVVLLSWKHDWLQQAEEHGAAASAYLQKHSAPEAVLATVHEVLAAHARFERRLRQEGPVRGRLDGTAPYRLLRLACATRPSARMTLRCHPHAYEVHIRDGAPRAATRLSADGALLRAEAALASLLAERAGRFTLAAETPPIDRELTGSLHQQIAAYVARARGLAAKPAATVALSPALVAAPPGLVAPQVIAAPAVPPRSFFEPAIRTLPIVMRALSPRSTPERTLPLAMPEPRPGPTPPRSEPREAEPAARVRAPRSWRAPLRVAAVVAIAVLGIALGAGVRAMRQPAPPAPPASAPQVVQVDPVEEPTEPLATPPVGLRASRLPAARPR
ncbi:MAG TPA: response regulator [Polyangiaceae bacterium]